VRDDESGEKKSMLSADYGEEGEHDIYGDENGDEMEDAPSGSADESDLDAMMQGMEEDEMQDLKLPDDLEGGLEDEDEEDEDEGLFPEDPDKTPFPDFAQEEDDYENTKANEGSDGEDAMNDVFAAARENKEMNIVESMRRKVEAGESFVNEDLFKKMDTIEDEMMNPKEWQMLGEARGGERPKNSLLNVHLDFNTATKAPPTVTKDTTTAIDALIK
jgi:U3 small nucleolar RNA-associated protein MPP10